MFRILKGSSPKFLFSVTHVITENSQMAQVKSFNSYNSQMARLDYCFRLGMFAVEILHVLCLHFDGLLWFNMAQLSPRL